MCVQISLLLRETAMRSFTSDSLHLKNCKLACDIRYIRTSTKRSKCIFLLFFYWNSSFAKLRFSPKNCNKSYFSNIQRNKRRCCVCGVQSLDSLSMDEWIRDGHDFYYIIVFNWPKKKELPLHTLYFSLFLHGEVA